jgi:quercetin dioxygenase-like cupin family protein
LQNRRVQRLNAALTDPQEKEATMKETTKKILAIASYVLIGSVAGVFGQDVMQQRLPFLKVMAEDDKVRVLRYAPAAGDKSAIHSHPEAVVVVLKGGRVRYTFPDGTHRVVELKTGDAMIRPSVIHIDEALDPVECILVEIKY